MNINTKNAAMILIAASLAVGIFVGLGAKTGFPDFEGIFNFPGIPEGGESGEVIVTDHKIVKFTSKEDFVNYLTEAQQSLGFGFGNALMDGGAPMMMEDRGMALTLPEGMGGGGMPGRVSQTNVQVLGIDEPDIVKTDGKEIYFSLNKYGPIIYEEFPTFPEGQRSEEMTGLPHYSNQQTKLIKAYPPADLAEDSAIDKYGNLLLAKNTLVIFNQANNTIYGYDVTKPKSPEQEWRLELDKGTSLVSARLYQDKIYFVTSTGINYIEPCPIVPFRLPGEDIRIPCERIYHPTVPFPVDVTFTASVLDPVSGKVQETTSFVGSRGTSVVYMSKNALYITYQYSGNFFNFFLDFLETKAGDLFPSSLLARLGKVATYELNDTTKMNEFMVVLQNYLNSLSQDEQRRLENELTNRMEDYAKMHMRELGKTGIVKIGLDKLDIAANGNVPGALLNQFSLDEYNNNLRVATTVGGSGFFGFGMGGGESANDVYVLDKKLKIIGLVKDLGLTERIYSARFIEDKGYLVTFRQVDPFYVLDLSNPKNPKLAGELKIPGYSAYLHPLAKNRILGIGQDGAKVKVSLFDVSSATDPKEADKYLLDEYWTEVSSNHHAFLSDPDHQIFYLPGGQSGYIFSYLDDRLELKRVVSDVQAKRAIYLGDYLYVIGDNKITVLNEKDWTEVNKLSL